MLNTNKINDLSFMCKDKFDDYDTQYALLRLGVCIDNPQATYYLGHCLIGREMSMDSLIIFAHSDKTEKDISDFCDKTIQEMNETVAKSKFGSGIDTDIVIGIILLEKSLKTFEDNRAIEELIHVYRANGMLDEYIRMLEIQAEKDSFYTSYNSRTIDELKELGVDIDIVRQVASTYSHIPQAAKLISKIQAVLPQTVTRIINMQDILMLVHTN